MHGKRHCDTGRSLMSECLVWIDLDVIGGSANLDKSSKVKVMTRPDIVKEWRRPWQLFIEFSPVITHYYKHHVSVFLISAALSTVDWGMLLCYSVVCGFLGLCPCWLKSLILSCSWHVKCHSMLMQFWQVELMVWWCILCCIIRLWTDYLLSYINCTWHCPWHRDRYYDVLTHSTFGSHRFRRFWMVGRSNFRFSIDFQRRSYNTLTLQCQRVMIMTVIIIIMVIDSFLAVDKWTTKGLANALTPATVTNTLGIITANILPTKLA